MQSKNTNFHPVHQVYDGIFNTASGKIINILDPNPDDIDIEDIAGALTKICRFGGNINRFWSVAQHSILVAWLAPLSHRREALLHDASEAYLGDVIKPLKVILGDAYARLENAFMGVIATKMELDPVKLHEVKQFDLRALEIEHECFQKGNELPMREAVNKLGFIPDWDMDTAQGVFLKAYIKLSDGTK